ncbi:MAG: phage tail protein [Actinomycetota bacterium]
MAAERRRQASWNRPFVAFVLACLAVGTTVGSSGGQTARAAAPPAQAITANRFSIVADGYEIASFAELSGITTEIEPVEYASSTDQGVVLEKLPGKVKPATITLKRGMNQSLELWAWHEAVRQGTMAAARKNVSLVMYDATGKPVAKYWLEQAWPSKLELAGLKAGASEVLMETVTLTAENIQRIAA